MIFRASVARKLPFDQASTAFNLRIFFAAMNRLIALCLVAVSTAVVTDVRAADSLLDPARARPLTKDQAAFFGPKARTLTYDARMIRAAEIAQKRARAKMTWHCWKYVKDALLAAGVIDTRPQSRWAGQAGEELCRTYGFTKLRITDPYRAPVGAVVVYAGADGGHVEIRTANGFVSDFASRTAYPRPVIGIYVKAA